MLSPHPSPHHALAAHTSDMDILQAQMQSLLEELSITRVAVSDAQHARHRVAAHRDRLARRLGRGPRGRLRAWWSRWVFAVSVRHLQQGFAQLKAMGEARSSQGPETGRVGAFVASLRQRALRRRVVEHWRHSVQETLAVRRAVILRDSSGRSARTVEDLRHAVAGWRSIAEQRRLRARWAAFTTTGPRQPSASSGLRCWHSWRCQALEARAERCTASSVAGGRLAGLHAAEALMRRRGVASVRLCWHGWLAARRSASAARRGAARLRRGSRAGMLRMTVLEWRWAAAADVADRVRRVGQEWEALEGRRRGRLLDAAVALVNRGNSGFIVRAAFNCWVRRLEKCQRAERVQRFAFRYCALLALAHALVAWSRAVHGLRAARAEVASDSRVVHSRMQLRQWVIQSMMCFRGAADIRWYFGQWAGAVRVCRLERTVSLQHRSLRGRGDLLHFVARSIGYRPAQARHLLLLACLSSWRLQAAQTTANSSRSQHSARLCSLSAVVARRQDADAGRHLLYIWHRHCWRRRMDRRGFPFRLLLRCLTGWRRVAQGVECCALAPATAGDAAKTAVSAGAPSHARAQLDAIECALQNMSFPVFSTLQWDYSSLASPSKTPG
mmetsp:Transcript_126587/g.289493  ORF Transcript_126587/g.289493 Transcript_126587/m.289493 type:complete len:613 (+) Transcript_126587:27-1865(+)